MIVVDSSVWIDYFRGAVTPESDKLDAVLGIDVLAVGDLMLAEVLQGFDSDRDFDRALQLFETLTIIEIGGAEIAIEAARNFRALRSRGGAVRLRQVTSPSRLLRNFVSAFQRPA